MAAGRTWPQEGMTGRPARPGPSPVRRRSRGRRRNRNPARAERLPPLLRLLRHQTDPRSPDSVRRRSGGEILRRRGSGATTADPGACLRPAGGPLAPSRSAQRSNGLLRGLPDRILRPHPVACSIGVLFFLWVGVFNLMIVAQFWSFANDSIPRNRASGFSPSSHLADRRRGGRQCLPRAHSHHRGAPTAAGGSGTPRCRWRDQHHGRHPGAGAARNPSARHLTTGEIPAATGEYQIEMVEDVKKLTVSLPGTKPVGRRGTFRLVFADHYLLLIAFLMLVLNWVNTTGEYILGRTVAGAAEASVAAGQAGGMSVQEYIGSFYSEFLFIVSVASMVLQLFVVSRLIKYSGCAGRNSGTPDLGADRIRGSGFHPHSQSGPDGEDRGKRHRLLGAEHRTQRALSSHQPGSEVQGQTGNRLIFRSGRRRAFRRSRLRRHHLAGARPPNGFARVNLVLAVVWLVLAFAIGREYGRKSRAQQTSARW